MRVSYYPLDAIATTTEGVIMPWMSLEEFIDQLECKVCKRCDKRATWFSNNDLPSYCDEHYPYHPESAKEVMEKRLKSNPELKKAYEKEKKKSQ